MKSISAFWQCPECRRSNASFIGAIRVSEHARPQYLAAMVCKCGSSLVLPFENFEQLGNKMKELNK